jgi:hypothetical protein
MENFWFDDPLDDLKSLLGSQACFNDLLPFLQDHGLE